MEKKEYRQSGIKLRYYETGEGKTIIFLHALAVEALSYKQIISAIAKSYHVIAPDLPGFGGSSVPDKNWDFTDYAKFLSGFIDSLGYDQVILVGHSFGGGIAYHLASLNKKVDKLVLVNPLILPVSYSFGKMLYLFSIKKTIYDLRYILTNPFMMVFVRDFFSNFFRNFFSLKKIITTVWNSSTKEYKNIKLSCPVLLLFSKDDEFFGKNYLTGFKAIIPNSYQILVGGNHDWIFYKTEEFCGYVRKFVSLRGPTSFQDKIIL
ncbi:MAG: Hydrolase, alpha/beta fold family protein [Candidatus Gottesmanbacteria bacterium GW2011_GWC2_39_8]|uniref:Hydrolase, alpha/beta fold family protein n=1 Tax=Candidatus Gottesmanbacteria bacterium GW2011_GWC2_39_8 TaxID=1618450 RepID=A0A0G0SHP3_9BACT|nr:MAG: Hydrolase, alpha/beta fold family protein [Candidatus Gottesmanbacteria bacterium GW2011_GWC2_39_8]